jgi:hypothetical protein
MVEVWQAISAGVSVLVLVLVPVAIYMNHKVIRPMSWVLGLKADESPTGEVIPPIPQQLSELRNQGKDRAIQIAAIRKELHPNGGSSLRDVTDFNAIALDEARKHMVALEAHMAKHDTEERVIWHFLTTSVKELAAGQVDAAVIAEQAATLLITTASGLEDHRATDARAVAKMAIDTASEVGQIRRQNAADVARMAVDAAAALEEKDHGAA